MVDHHAALEPLSQLTKALICSDVDSLAIDLGLLIEALSRPVYDPLRGELQSGLDREEFPHRPNVGHGNEISQRVLAGAIEDMLLCDLMLVVTKPFLD